MNALERRAAAARELVRTGEVSGDVALSYVVWPTLELEQASEDVTRHEWSDAAREEARCLAGQGWSQARIAEQVCGARRFRSTVQLWLKPGPAAV